MKTSVYGFFTAVVFSLMLAGAPSPAAAGVHVNVGINLPPFTFAAPPPVVVIPGTYAYFAPGADIDIVFYGGFWYRPYEGHWFRSRDYNGPWAGIEMGRVPRALRELPPEYRRHYRDRPRIEYREFHRNWRRWEKSRHWEKDKSWQPERERRRPYREERREGGKYQKERY